MPEDPFLTGGGWDESGKATSAGLHGAGQRGTSQARFHVIPELCGDINLSLMSQKKLICPCHRVQPRISNDSDQRLGIIFWSRENSLPQKKTLATGRCSGLGCVDSPPQRPLYGVAVRSPWILGGV